MNLHPYDHLIVANRPAVFLWWMWKGRSYAHIRFTDNNERTVAHVMDIKPLAEACADAVREAFGLEARL